MEKERLDYINYMIDTTKNRTNGLVEFGFYLDLLSVELKKSYDEGKPAGTIYEWIDIIRTDYKYLLSSRMNKLTKKTIKKL
jgi:hypothetical protein